MDIYDVVAIGWIAICIVFLSLTTGCAKVTHEVVGNPEVLYKTEPVYIIITGNPVTIPPYEVSGNEIIFK